MRSAISPMGAGDMAKDYIIDYGNNSNGWWRKWKSGFIEQWGRCNSVIYNETSMNVIFPIPMTNLDYYATSNPLDNNVGGSWTVATRVAILNIEGMTVRGGINATAAWTGKATWYICGY